MEKRVPRSSMEMTWPGGFHSLLRASSVSWAAGSSSEAVLRASIKSMVLCIDGRLAVSARTEMSTTGRCLRWYSMLNPPGGIGEGVHNCSSIMSILTEKQLEWTTYLVRLILWRCQRPVTSHLWWFLHRVNTNRKAAQMNNLPHQADLLKVLETGDQPFVVVPLLGVNTNRKPAQMNNLPRQADLLKVSETGDQPFVVVPAFDVSISQKKYLMWTTYLSRVFFWRCWGPMIRPLR